MSDLISRQTVIDMVKGWNLNQHIMNEEDAIDDVNALPSAQPEYEPVTLEDFARTMSGITVWGFAAWQGWALALIKDQGFVICKETM